MEEEFLSKKRTLEDDSDTINFERAQRNQWQKHKKAKLNELMQNSSNPIVNEYKEKKRKETKEFRRGPGTIVSSRLFDYELISLTFFRCPVHQGSKTSAMDWSFS